MPWSADKCRPRHFPRSSVRVDSRFGLGSALNKRALLMIPLLAEYIPILERTPRIVRELLSGLDDTWSRQNDGPGTWSPYDIVGHLIHGERADWLPRVDHIIRNGTSTPFPPFDREAMFRESIGKSLADLLDEFASLRRESLAKLSETNVSEPELRLRGLHPALGEVTMSQLLSTWVVHDLSHIAQIARTMARRLTEAVGPWKAYLPILAPRDR